VTSLLRLAGIAQLHTLHLKSMAKFCRADLTLIIEALEIPTRTGIITKNLHFTLCT
jgi:hypothetical protein